MKISRTELICSGVTNATLWGLPMGLFILNLAFDHPGRKQKTITYLSSAAIFCLLGSTIHYGVTDIYQNPTADAALTLRRSVCVLATTLITPLAAMSLITLGTLKIRSARKKSISVIKYCLKPHIIAAFTTSTLTLHFVFSQIFSDNSPSTPLISKKTVAQIGTSSLISCSAIFFASCFSIL
ncbi:MAG: hypothetical protein KDK44_02260 [Chlamydiia bacterium]|nr:hypothetical protein [Chlamydiia bacterium]MCP5510169.1 hypothetical protein [Chlamydiales bacterium]HPE84562.1 hypothetical protein [Chlamydiales bacterium]